MNGKGNTTFRREVSCTEREGLVREVHSEVHNCNVLFPKIWRVKRSNMLVLSTEYLAVPYPLCSLLYVWNISQLKIKRKICYFVFFSPGKVFFTSLKILCPVGLPAEVDWIESDNTSIFSQLVDVLAKEW